MVRRLRGRLQLVGVPGQEHFGLVPMPREGGPESLTL